MSTPSTPDPAEATNLDSAAETVNRYLPDMSADHPLPAALRIVLAELDRRGERITELEAEAAKLREHILDIDAHATPYGDLPEDPGYVGVYLVTSGALHRALGKVGHTSPSCQAEAERDRLRSQRDAALTLADAATPQMHLNDGVRRPVAWNLDPVALRRALTEETP